MSILARIHQIEIVPKWYIITGKLHSIAQKVTANIVQRKWGIFIVSKKFSNFLWKSNIPKVAQNESQNHASKTIKSGLNDR
jgi:hypothetical protein